MKDKKSKLKLTRRQILLLINGAFFLVALVCFIMYTVKVLGYQDELSDVAVVTTMLSFLSTQCTFTCLTLIVYYLSIIAGALKNKYKEEVKDAEDYK